MYAHTYTSIYTYIFITACGPLKHQRVMSGRRSQRTYLNNVETMSPGDSLNHK